jgi:hypothetical protein
MRQKVILDHSRSMVASHSLWKCAPKRTTPCNLHTSPSVCEANQSFPWAALAPARMTVKPNYRCLQRQGWTCDRRMEDFRPVPAPSFTRSITGGGVQVVGTGYQIGGQHEQAVGLSSTLDTIRAAMAEGRLGGGFCLFRMAQAQAHTFRMTRGTPLYARAMPVYLRGP